jgi:predicted peptidase
LAVNSSAVFRLNSPLFTISSTFHFPKLRAISNPGSYDYLVSQPLDSDAEGGRRWPLILFLHGAAERGSQIADVARQGLPKMLLPTAELSRAEIAIASEVAARFVVVAPQCPHYEVWDEDKLLRLLDEVGPQFNIDPARVYLTGLSMGGFGVWLVGLRHPQRFAALAPVCGGGRIADVEITASKQPEALRHLGVWAFHGAYDQVVPLEESERMVDALRRAQVPDVKLTIYADGEHDAWTAAYANPALYQWLLQHTR